MTINNDDIQLSIKHTADAMKELGRAAARHPDSKGRAFDLNAAKKCLQDALSEISGSGLEGENHE